MKTINRRPDLMQAMLYGTLRICKDLSAKIQGEANVNEALAQSMMVYNEYLKYSEELRIFYSGEAEKIINTDQSIIKIMDDMLVAFEEKTISKALRRGYSVGIFTTLSIGLLIYLIFKFL